MKRDAGNILYLSFHEHMHIYLVDIYLGVEELGDRVLTYLFLVDTAKEFSKIIIAVYTPIAGCIPDCF